MKIPGEVLAPLAGCGSGNARAIDTSANGSGNTYSGNYVEDSHVHDETAGFDMADILSRYKVKAACEVVSGDSAMEEARTRGRIAAEAAGSDTTEVPSWSEVKAAREANPNHPKCHWENTHTLFTEVDGVVEYLTPEEAVEKYGSDEDFMREYMLLMTRRK